MSRRKLPISGPMLQEKALQFAISGEKADVNIAVVEDWKEKLPTLLEGYNPCDIFNMD